MQALYCLLYKKWKNHLLEREKAACRISGNRCSRCPRCVWKVIEEDLDE